MIVEPKCNGAIIYEIPWKLQTNEETVLLKIRNRIKAHSQLTAGRKRIVCTVFRVKSVIYIVFR